MADDLIQQYGEDNSELAKRRRIYFFISSRFGVDINTLGIAAVGLL